MIFRLYMRRGFDWCMVCWFLELCTAEPPCMRSEKTTGDCSSGVWCFLGFEWCGFHVCACVSVWLAWICLTIHACVENLMCACWLFNEAVRFDIWIWTVDLFSAPDRVVIIFSEFIQICLFPSISICYFNYFSHLIKIIKYRKMIQINSNFIS